MHIPGTKKSRAKKLLKEALGGADPPSFPSLTLRILDKLRDPEVDFEEIAEAIRWDAGLTVKLLGTVNSAAYAPKREIQDVRHAISYLGRGPLESIVLAVTAAGAVPSPRARGFEPPRFWRVAARRATLARAFAGRLHPATESESFTAALLLDLAVPMMTSVFGDRYSDALEEWHSTPGRELVEIERDFVEKTHGEIGGLLADSWDLPTGLRVAIEQHHDAFGGHLVPEEGEVLPAIALVSGAREVSPDHAIEAMVERARSDFGLEPDWVVETCGSSEADSAELASLLSKN